VRRIRVTDEPLDVAALSAAVRDPRAGAVVLFEGVTREVPELEYEAYVEMAEPRLEAIAAESDGFRLAEVDLELRGAGDVLGTRQHGLPELRIARLPEDARLLERARAVADELLAADAELDAPENVLLRDAAARRFGSELEPIPA
jgi:hypothetical protein